MFKGKIENILEAALFFLQALIIHGFQISLTPAEKSLQYGTALEQWYGNPATQKMQVVHLQWKTPSHSNRVR